MQLLNGVAQGRGVRQKILLRLSPGIDPHTHAKTTTGTLDNKFGIPMPTGQAEAAVRQALDMPGVELVGLHVHLGSPVFELEPYAEAVDTVLEFASRMKKTYGFEMREFSPGGGFAVAYTPDQHAPEPAAYAETVTSTLRESLWRHELSAPQLIVEPGRSIVARAAVALYTVGSSKEVPGVSASSPSTAAWPTTSARRIYEARYSALVANRVHDERRETVTIAGKYCESGDVLMTRRRAAAAGGRRHPRDARRRRLRARDGEQLQPLAPPAGRPREGRRGEAHAPPRDVRRPHAR